MDSLDLYEIIKFGIEVLLIGGIASVVVGYYTKKQFELSRDEFKDRLFKKYNSYYGELNNSLHKIQALEADSENFTLDKLKRVHSDLYRDLNDYLNLCAEEKYWYKKERIDQPLWDSWQTGMDYWYNNLTTLKELWEKERKSSGYKSYYLNENEKLFSSETDRG